MDRIRSVISVFAVSITKSYLNPRVLISLLLTAAFCLISSMGPNRVWKELSMPYNIFEQNISLFSNMFYMIFMTIGLILLLCDAPFFDKGEVLIIYRVGRVKWFAGKILYIATTVLLYQIFIFIIQLALNASGGFLSTTVWSDVYRNAMPGSILILTYHIIPISSSIMLAMNPGTAFLHTNILIFLYFNILATIMFVVNIRFKRIIGVLIACSIWITGYLFNGIGEWMAMYSPLEHAMLVYHNIGESNTWMIGQPTLGQSYFILGLLLVSLVFLALMQIRKHSFKFGE